MSCKLDVIGGLANVKESTELQLAVSRYGQVKCCFIPPADLRDFEPGLVIFQESQSVQATVDACKEGKVVVRSQPLYCEPHDRRGADDSNWGRNKEQPSHAANSKRRKLPPQHQGDSRSHTHRQLPNDYRPGEVGSRLEGELSEEIMAKNNDRKIRFIKCEDLPERMKEMRDVFVLRPETVSHLPAGTKVSFILQEQNKTGKPQAADVEECTWQQKRGTGTPRARGGPRRAQGQKDPRLDRFIELNRLDSEVCKSLRNAHKSLQAAVIDHWEEAGLKVDQSGDRPIPPSAIVMAKLRTERERIGQKATARSTSRRRSFGAGEDDDRRSRSRSSARRSRSEESAATRSPSQQGADNDGGAGNSEATGGATDGAHETQLQKHTRPGCSRSHSRSRGSASRSLTPLKRDAILDARESQEQTKALEDNAGGSSLIQLTNAPSLNKGIMVCDYLADMLAPHLKELPDFNSQLGNPILQAWEEGQGTVFMKLQNADLAESAARAADGLHLFGCTMKVRSLSKDEADHLQGLDESRRQQQDSVPTRKVMLRAAA